ncbi:MAG: hypothetical protein JRG96_00745 [Deltaproteobacteria bacterium]|nr:hypothetical protein [Deltaproteobacteria bacterium]MBW2417193.1 hypothetical protein [Deltaproteobacteria bacterium]
MIQFGNYLLEKGALAPDQLDEALRYQSVYGGRIGTVLLELGFLVLEELAAHLTNYHGIPLAPPEWLENLDPEAVKAVPMSVVRRCQVLPLKLERHAIHVAMLDPTNLDHLDFVAMAAGREVVPYILPEARLHYWLEVHLGIDRHPRYFNLSQRLRIRGAPAAATPQSGTEAGSDPQPASSAPEEIILLEELVIEPSPPSTPRPSLRKQPTSSPDLRPGAIALLETQLESASERDEIVRLGLRIARCYSSAAALFVVRGASVAGIGANGEGMDETLQGIEMPLDTVSVFTHPAVNALPFRGPPPRDGPDGRILEAMKRPEPQEVFLHPVMIRERVVNVLYADNGSDSFGDTSAAALEALCECISRAYERLILAGKQR